MMGLWEGLELLRKSRNFITKARTHRILTTLKQLHQLIRVYISEQIGSVNNSHRSNKINQELPALMEIQTKG